METAEGVTSAIGSELADGEEVASDEVCADVDEDEVVADEVCADVDEDEAPPVALQLPPIPSCCCENAQCP